MSSPTQEKVTTIKFEIDPESFGREIVRISSRLDRIEAKSVIRLPNKGAA